MGDSRREASGCRVMLARKPRARSWRKERGKKDGKGGKRDSKRENAQENRGGMAANAPGEPRGASRRENTKGRKNASKSREDDGVKTMEWGRNKGAQGRKDKDVCPAELGICRAVNPERTRWRTKTCRYTPGVARRGGLAVALYRGTFSNREGKGKNWERDGLTVE